MTKENELKLNGCLSKAENDEMLFILRAQDRTAPKVILHWIELNIYTAPENKLREAFNCLIEMKKFRVHKMPD